MSTAPNDKRDTGEMNKKLAETREIHTRILRFQLGADESRAYWQRVDAADPQRPWQPALEERWFGAVSESRVKVIMREMQLRYDAYPPALHALANWEDMSPATRAVICHWHLQLADPLYRAFTGDFLEERRQALDPTVSREQVLRWVSRGNEERWGRTTRVAFASKLLTAAYHAGLVASTRDPRPLQYPRVSDRALSYMVHLLRELRIEGSLLDNPYLRSVGLSGTFLEDRLRTLPNITLRRMGHLVEFTTLTPNLSAWILRSHELSEAS